MIPDIEKVLTTYLRPKVSPLGATVRGRTPSNSAKGWVRLTVLDAPGSYPDHLVDALVQLDCYASKEGGQEDASILARTVRQALIDLPNNEHADAVVTGCAIVGYLRNPDTFFEPARDRYILTATVWMHSVPA